jgi:pyruvate dehydrogenase (quinone)
VHIFELSAKVDEDLQPDLQRAFKHQGRALVEVIVKRQELSMPPKISIDQALGFSLYMIRAVMNGDEVIDLARTNFLR